MTIHAEDYVPALKYGGKIVSDDIEGGAVIAADVTLTHNHILVGDATNLASDVALIKDATIDDTGALTVVGLQGFTVSATGPTTGQILISDGTFWTPTTLIKDATLDSAGNLTVVGLQGNTVVAGPYTAGDALIFDGTFWDHVPTSHVIALAATTAVYGGGGTSNAFTATGLLATDIVSAVIRTSANAVSIVKAVPTANTLTVDFSADPGAGTTVDYIAARASS